MRRLIPLFLSFLTLAIPPATSAGAGSPPKLFCEHPRTLRLHRFEDRSATLECAGRVIVRVSVPR